MANCGSIRFYIVVLSKLVAIGSVANGPIEVGYMSCTTVLLQQ